MRARHDAWNRLVSVTPSGGSAKTYSYDALGRRITETPAGGMTRVLLYSDLWQVLEEREGSTVKAQCVWSPVYVDALVRRDRDADGSSANGMEERLYVQQDANFNVTSVTNTSGVVQERYIYDPYGSFTVLDANWATDADGVSDVEWLYLHQGGRYDATSGLYHFRMRDYSPTLGRWVQQDPAGYVDGMSLYLYESSTPPSRLDPTGLADVPVGPQPVDSGAYPGNSPDPNAGLRGNKPWMCQGPKPPGGYPLPLQPIDPPAGPRPAGGYMGNAQGLAPSAFDPDFEVSVGTKAAGGAAAATSASASSAAASSGIGYTGALAGSGTLVGGGTLAGGAAFGSIALAGGGLFGAGIYWWNPGNYSDKVAPDFCRGATSKSGRTTILMTDPIPGMGRRPISATTQPSR